MEGTLLETRAHEKTLIKDLADEKQLLQSAAATHNDFVDGTKL